MSTFPDNFRLRRAMMISAGISRAAEAPRATPAQMSPCPIRSLTNNAMMVTAALSVA